MEKRGWVLDGVRERERERKRAINGKKTSQHEKTIPCYNYSTRKKETGKKLKNKDKCCTSIRTHSKHHSERVHRRTYQHPGIISKELECIEEYGVHALTDQQRHCRLLGHIREALAALWVQGITECGSTREHVRPHTCISPLRITTFSALVKINKSLHSLITYPTQLLVLQKLTNKHNAIARVCPCHVRNCGHCCAADKSQLYARNIGKICYDSHALVRD